MNQYRFKIESDVHKYIEAIYIAVIQSHKVLEIIKCQDTYNVGCLIV